MSTVLQEASAQEHNLSSTLGSIQLVSFRLAQEEYGIEITRVREIILMGAIMRVPQDPALRQGADQPPQYGDPGD